MFQIIRNLFSLNFIWANFEQNQRNFFSKKKANFPTWNRIFFQLSKKNRECSKIPKIYLAWTSSERILSKIRDTFFSKKKASLVVGIWKKIPKFSQFSNFKSNFFLIFQKKAQIFQNSAKLFILNFIWANFQQI